MIVKFLSRHSPSYSSLIEYILKDGKGEEGLSPEPYLHNFRGTTKSEWVNELYQNEAFRKQTRKGQVYFYHAILSFNNRDTGQISTELLKQITTKFIELRGKNGMFLTAQHQDKDHLHIHCLISALEFKTGKAFRMTKSQLNELKIGLQNYQIDKFPELIHSLPKHGLGKDYMYFNEQIETEKNPRASKKQLLSKTINEVLISSINLQQFLTGLREKGLHHYERAGKVYGIIHEGKNYRFTTLGLDMDKFKTLPEDLTEISIALDEIRKLRKGMETLSRNGIQNTILEADNFDELTI